MTLPLASHAGRKRTDAAANQQIGARLRAARRAAGLTKHDLAAHLGISYQQMHKLEIGSNAISAARLYLLSRILAVPIAFFFEAAEDWAWTELSPRERTRLVRGFSQIRDPQRRCHLLELVKGLAPPS